MSREVVLYDGQIFDEHGHDAHAGDWNPRRSRLRVVQNIDDETNSSSLMITYGFEPRIGYNTEHTYVATTNWSASVVYKGAVVKTNSTQIATLNWTTSPNSSYRRHLVMFSVDNIKHNPDGTVPSDALQIKVKGFVLSCNDNDFHDDSSYPWNDPSSNPYEYIYDNDVNELIRSWGNTTSTTTLQLQPSIVYNLTVSPGANSSITVERTSSGYASPGVIQNGAYIYGGDDLRITFTPAYHYKITHATVNTVAFVSGNTYKVVGDTTVISVAELFLSSVQAQNAYIGNRSQLNIDKYQASDYHSIKYTFGSQTGYIKSDGTVSATEVRYTNQIVEFLLPDSFYTEIPNAKSGSCTLECTTYEHASDAQSLGRVTTTTFSALANPSQCSPIIVGTVVDTNVSTLALTNNASRLVRYRSTAECTWTVSPRKSATIVGVKVNGKSPTNSKVVFSNVDNNVFEFVATDSRGITGTYVATLDMINYIILTSNPTLFRISPTDDGIYMTISGDWFRGSFDTAHPEIQNDLWVSYRYHRVNGNWSTWQSVSAADITHNPSSYESNTNIQLNPIQDPTDFDYRYRFIFEILVRDGVTDSGGTVHYLSSVTKTITVERGLPVFDWGENDFRVNVDFQAVQNAVFSGNINVGGNASITGDTDISGDAQVSGSLDVGGTLTVGGVSFLEFFLSVMYPVNSVFLYGSNTLPPDLAQIGTWSSVATGITGVYGWVRTQ